MTERANLAATREYFGARASGWEERFAEYEPAYAQAVADFAPPVGGLTVDVGCGTGRALPYIRDAVGPEGAAVGVDGTPEMLKEAIRRGRDQLSWLMLADLRAIPLPDRVAAGVWAAGLLPHLDDPDRVLLEMARICQPGARLAIFHPVGRVELPKRCGAPDADFWLEPRRLTALLERTGWVLADLDDAQDRFLALGVRRDRPAGSRQSRFIWSVPG